MYFPKEEYEARWSKVYDEMDRRGFDAAVIWGRSAGTYERCGDVLYLTNFYSNHSGHELDNRLWNGRSFSAVILAERQVPELHIDEPEVRTDVIATDHVVPHLYDSISGTAEGVNARKLEGEVALVGWDFLPAKYFQQLQAATPQVEWIPADDLLRSVRRIKSPRELDCYRHAGMIASRALNKLMEGLMSGKAESEAAAAAASEVIGAGGNFHMIPVNHGDTMHYFCRSPLTGFSEDAPAPGDMVRGWVYGPIYQGYWLDPGRTAISGGDGTSERRQLIEKCAEIVDACIDAIRPGVSAVEVGRLGDAMQREAGGQVDVAGQQWPLYGHGVGLFWEPPIIGPETADPDEVFTADMTLGVEAFLAREGVGAAGFEQNIIVHEDGNELLTTTPMIWH
jgi:Xaa-Pro aminopeptidase